MSKMKSSLFDAKTLAAIRTRLIEEKTHLEAEMGKFATKNQRGDGNFTASFPEYGNEEDDNAREVAEYATNKQLEEALERDLRDTTKALARVEDGTYGICKYCDQPIDAKRLMARPTSGACVSCKKTLTDEA